MAKSRSIGGIYAELSLRDGKFKAGLKSARAALGSFAGKAATVGFTAVTTSATAAGVAMIAGTRRTLDQVDALGDLSAQTGVAVSDLMKIQQAYKDGGRSADMASTDIGKMQKSIVEAADGGNDPFKSIGLSAEALFQMNPAKQFQDIGDAILGIANPAERTAKAMEIFGRSGMGLTTVFPGIESAEKALGRMPELAETFASAMGDANDLLGHLPLKSDQFFTGFTAGIIGTLLPELGKIDEHDFSDVGLNFGTALAGAFDETQWQIWGLAGMEEITKLGAALADSLEISGKGLLSNINASAETFGQSIAKKGFYTYHNAMDGNDPKWQNFKKKNGEHGENLGKSFDENLANEFKKWEVPKNLRDALDVLSKSKDELQKSLDLKMQKRSDAVSGSNNAARDADEIFGKLFRDQALAGLTGTPAAITPAKPAASAAAPAANDYQRRGLSLDANGGVANQGKEAIGLLKELRDILKMASKTGMLTWP